MATTKQKRSNKIIWILLGVVVLLGVVAVIIQKSKKKETEVQVVKPKLTTIIEKISASGMVQPVIEVKLSPDVAGEIIALEVEEGDSVSQGQLLVKIRPDNYISAKQRAEASLSQQKANRKATYANLERSKATFQRAEAEKVRNQALFDDEVISKSEWELIIQNYKVAENDLAAVEASVDAAHYIVKSSEAALADSRENLRKTTVFAPISGTVSKLNVEKGERVVGTSQMAGTEMLRIADLNKMEVRVDVNENDIIRISEGDTAIIDVDAYTNLDKKFKGIVTQIANTAKDKASADAVTEFEVKVRILNSSFRDLVEEGNRYPFKPGMTASVDIITRTKVNVLSVPLAAVTVRNIDAFKEKEGDEEDVDDNQNTDVNTDENREKEETKEAIFINNDGVAKILEVETGISDFENIELITEIPDTVEVVVGPFLAVSKMLKNGDHLKKSEKGENKKNDD